MHPISNAAAGQAGDLCNYDLVTGNQGGLSTPVRATVVFSGSQAVATVTQANGQQGTTLVIVDDSGTALVDDIYYNDTTHRSVYSLNCTATFG